MSRQRPPNLTISQLLRRNLTRERSIRLIKHILTADFDLRLEVFANEEEEEARRRDDNLYWSRRIGSARVPKTM
jgi:hypothetical protein